MFIKENLELFLDRLVQERIAGCSMLVLHKDKEVFRHYCGYADLGLQKEVNADTIFRIYSMTKIVTVTAALQLYEKGLFCMNDPLESYMPEFSDMLVADRKADGTEYLRPAKNKILVKDLFCMTAGFTYNGYDDKESPVIRETCRMEQKLSEQYPGKTYSISRYASEMAKLPLANDPGTHWQYSLGHNVLAALVERISGIRFSDYVKENITEPLGIQDTFFRISGNKKARLASIYDLDKEGKLVQNTGMDVGFLEGAVYESGGGGLLSTLDDYAKFANALCRGGTAENGTRILSSNTINLMRTNHLDETMLKDYDWERLAGYGYGLGVRTMIDLVKSGSNGNVGEFGWSGMAGTWVMMDPKEKLTVVYMQQLCSEKTSCYIHPRLRNLVYSAMEGEDER